MEKKNQHYIPQMYLKLFTDFTSRNQERVTPYLHVFEKHSNNPFKSYPKSPEKVAKGSNYYSLNNNDKKARVLIENELSKIERDANTILRNIIDNKYKVKISDAERLILSQFVAVMECRVPEHKEMIREFNEDLHHLMIDVITCDRDRFKGQLIRAGEATGKSLYKTEKEIDDLLEFARSDRYKINVPNEYVNSLAFVGVDVITECIMNMNWEFLIAPQDIYFLTSDNPVVLFDDNHKHGIYGIGYKSSPSVELTFPINPEVCLHMEWLRKRRKNEYRSRVIKASSVRNINLRTCNYSTEYVFSCQEKLQVDINEITSK